MGGGALVSSGSWTLASPHDARAQGLIVSPFSDLDAGIALLLELPHGCGGAWLAALSEVAPVTSAERPAEGGSHAPSVAIAFTATGLQSIGLDGDCLKTFSTPFSEGMRQIDRQRRLGDAAGSIALRPEGLLWSGNAEDPYSGDRAAKPTPETVHVALLIYHRDEDSLAALVKQIEANLKPFEVLVVRSIGLRLRDQNGEIREHFGFLDGVSQPIPYGEAILAGGAPRPADPWHAVAAGDLLIGHQDANFEPAPGPVISESLPGAMDLPRGHAPFGYRDFGLDGSYLVIRELLQNVGDFWRSMDDAAAKLGCDRQSMAARVVGRNLGGDPLRPDGIVPKEGGQPANDFGYREADALGLGCPIGSHIRRANPRDSLAPTTGEGPLFLYVSNRHRILRRGRKFGPPYKKDAQADKKDAHAERGLLFIAINTDIARQFEFIQQTWMLNPYFGRLYDEIDPLVGREGSFTVPSKPVGSRVDLTSYIQLAGGDYFFLPSLPVIRYLMKLA
jgi:Dyp-type peroxidase family